MGNGMLRKSCAFKIGTQYIIWEGLEDEDPINPKVDECVQKIETVCREILSKRNILQDFIKHPLFQKIKERLANHAMK